MPDTTAEAARLLAAGWEFDEEFPKYVPWRKPGVTGRVDLRTALAIEAGEKCPAFFCHGPGHQSKTDCELTGDHEIHEAHVHGELARWRQGAYTAKLREGRVEFDERSYPDGIGMSGFFDEIEEVDE